MLEAWPSLFVCVSGFSIYSFDHNTKDSLIEDPVDRGYCQWGTGTM